MPFMRWKGIDWHGTVHHGTAYVLTPEDLEKTLLTNGIGPIALHIKQRNMRHKPRLEHKVQLYTILTTLVENGIYIDRAWHVSAQSLQHPGLQEITREIGQLVRSGMSCAQACSLYPFLFDPITCALLYAAEKSGSIASALRAIVQYHQTTLHFKTRMRQAITMPLITLGMSIALLCSIIVYIIPLFAQLYEQLHKEVPTSLHMLNHYGPPSIITIMIALSVLGFIYYSDYAPKRLRTIMHTMIARSTLHIPFVHTIIRQRHAAESLKTISLLIIAKIPIVEALIVMHRNQGDTMSIAWSNVIIAIEHGISLVDALKKENVMLSPEAYELIICGQETGMLGPLLNQAGENMHHHCMEKMTFLTHLLQPILIAVIAFFIIFVIITVYVPIINFSHALQ
jgi:type IV pilus assembly protein PilC